MWTTKDIPDQTGKTVIITGSNTGIGFETAKALYEKGARVIMACRDLEKADIAAAEIKNGTGDGILEIEFIDLSSLASIHAFCTRITQRLAAIDLLINNAGLMTPPKSLTKDGFESQFGVNYLGHFALTGYLYPMLSETENSRIVTVTSLAYTMGKIDFDNLKAENSYDAFNEYCQSKLANLIFAIQLQNRINEKGDQVLSLAAHPGIAKTEIARHMSATELAVASERFGEFMEASQGALSVLYAAVAADVVKAGFYGPDADSGLRGFPAKTTILENAQDQLVAVKLWQFSEAKTGIVFP